MNIQTFSSIEEALSLLTGTRLGVYYPDKWGTGWESTRFITCNIHELDNYIKKEYSMILHNNSMMTQEVMWYDDKKYHVVVLGHNETITCYYKDVMEFYNNGLGLKEYIEARLL